MSDETTDVNETSDVDEGTDVDVAPAAAEPPPPVDPNAVTVNLNGRDIVATKGEMVIAAAQREGEYIPHFCYHPRMDPVGMCRQCMVEVEGPRGPMMVVSCMTPVGNGQVVRTDTDDVKRAQEGILELLLANHPLDCPVCDKGGECPLQDQAFSHGPGESRYLEEKRHFEKPIPISDLVYLDRERCILCDRCTRFADEIAGDKLIHFTQRGNNTQVMTFPDEPFVSYFSGNTVQICPVGALTARPYRFKARPWDLDQLESTCTTCSVGCRTVIQSSHDELLRYQGVDSEEVNHGWLCDRGRFNFEAVNSEHRLTAPLVKTESGLCETSWSSALDGARSLIADALAEGGPESIAVLGGARGTNEDAYAWAQLADAIGASYRDAQLGDGLPVGVLGLDRATIEEAASADTIVLLAPDLKEELPVLYLRLRQAAEKRGSRILEFSPIDTGLTRYAWKSLRYEPGTQRRVVENALADGEVAAQLSSGSVVVVAGRANLAESVDATVAAIGSLLAAVPDLKVLPALRRGNVVGALALGLAPSSDDRDAVAALKAAADGRIGLLVLLGVDPLNDLPDADLARRAIAGARRILSVDTFPSESTQRADVVLAAAAYGEKSGTTTNIEGRVSPVVEKVTARGITRPDWMIAVELGAMLGDRSFGADHPLASAATFDDVTAAIAATVPSYAGVTFEAVTARADGVLAGPIDAELPIAAFEAPTRNGYDHRLVVGRKLYDRAVGTEMSRSLAHLAPGAAAHVNPLDLERIGVADGDEVELVGARGTAVLPMRANPSVARGTLWAPFNQGGRAIEELIDIGAAIADVRIERIG
ncbi:MAG: NADH-quinone oxidoreductase subunit NuoG [Acidimicrobiia bacterium]|nr:NADH-quinone oxidoreductase subunit NuoG [Acidimicrobiia bacterium]